MGWECYEIGIRLPRWQVYRLLVSFANDSKLLSKGKVEFLVQGIRSPEQEDDLEVCLIIDGRKRKRGIDKGPLTFKPIPSMITVPQEIVDKYEREGRLGELLLRGHPEERGGVIGAVRLLTAGNDTIARFITKDVRFHEAITDDEAAYLHKVVQFIKNYLEKHGLLMSTEEIKPSAANDDISIDKFLPSDREMVKHARGDPKLDLKQRTIIEVVALIRSEGLSATNSRVARRLVNFGIVSPKTGGPYHEKTIGRYRHELQEMGYHDMGS
jgi:hypothetical protein